MSLRQKKCPFYLGGKPDTDSISSEHGPLLAGSGCVAADVPRDPRADVRRKRPRDLGRLVPARESRIPQRHVLQLRRVPQARTHGTHHAARELAEMGVRAEHAGALEASREPDSAASRRRAHRRRGAAPYGHRGPRASRRHRRGICRRLARVAQGHGDRGRRQRRRRAGGDGSIHAEGTACELDIIIFRR